MEKPDQNIENQIMKKIEDGRIKMRSRYIFVAKRLGLGSGLVLSLVLSIFFLNLVFFYIKSTGQWDYLRLGSNGLLIFFYSFPYKWFGLCIISFVIAKYLTAKYDFSYKKPLIITLIGLIILITITATAIAAGDINQKMTDLVTSCPHRAAMLRLFYKSDSTPHPLGARGRIIELVDDQNIKILEPSGKRELFFGPKQKTILSEAEIGQRIIATGKQQNNKFIVNRARLLEMNAKELHQPGNQPCRLLK